MAEGAGGGHGASVAAWVVVAVIIAGTIIGGIALIEWIWPLFWVGVGLIVVGGVGMYTTRMMDMVSEYEMRSAPDAEAH
jgi:fatty acid desaturase